MVSSLYSMLLNPTCPDVSGMITVGNYYLKASIKSYPTLYSEDYTMDTVKSAV